MCKPYPGPRCSNHTLARKKKLWETLVAARAEYPENSLAVSQAEAAYQQALEDYLATPAGLETLKNNPTLQAKYKRKREYQLEAFQETQNQRVQLFAELAAETQPFYTAPEIETILNAARIQEQNLHPMLDAGTEEGRNNQYQKFLERYETHLKTTGMFTPEMQNIMMRLRSLPAPAEQLSLNVYRNIPEILKESQTQLKQELHRVGLIQDTTTTTAAVYFETYRDEYTNKYAGLPKKQQPNAPAEWVDGTYPHTGYTQNPGTNLIPTDPATMYALNRLRSDPKAVPDYRKKARVLAAVKKTDNTVNIVMYNTKGNLVGNYQTSSDNMFDVAGKIEGKILITTPDTETTSYLKTLNTRTATKINHIPLGDIASKQLNIPNPSLSHICEATGVSPEPGSTGLEPEILLKAYLSARKITAKTWRSKTVRKTAPAVEPDQDGVNRWGVVLTA